MTRTRKRTRRRDGFTLVEVMTAVALMVVASAGILTMQGATTKANELAQETTVAIDFAQTWMERLKRDSLRWTAVGDAARTAGPTYLSMAVSGPGDDIWNVPAIPAPAAPGPGPATTPFESPAADAFGFDLSNDALARIRYCMGFRNVVQHMAADPLAGGLGIDTIRVDVRVWWHRKNFSQTLGNMVAQGCDAPPAGLGSRNDMRVVYLSNVLRWEDSN